MSDRVALLASFWLLVLAAGGAVSAENSEIEWQTSGKTEGDRWAPALTFGVFSYDPEAEGGLGTFVPDRGGNSCRLSMLGSRTYLFAPVQVCFPWTKQTYHHLGPGAEIEVLLIPGQRVSFSLDGPAHFL